MSMIRDLRAVVRPALRKTSTPYSGYDTTRDPSASSAVVDCAVYRDGQRVQSVEDTSCLTPREAMRRVREGGGFAWIGLHEPTEAEFAGIAAEFGLHPLAVEDAVHAHQRPKLERYDDTLFSVFKTIRYVEHDELTATSEVVETGELMVFTGAGLRHHRPARQPRLARPAAQGLEDDARAPRQGPVGGAARDRRPGGRRLPGGRGRHAGRHRRGRDRGLLAEDAGAVTRAGSTSSSARCSS